MVFASYSRNGLISKRNSDQRAGSRLTGIISIFLYLKPNENVLLVFVIQTRFKRLADLPVRPNSFSFLSRSYQASAWFLCHIQTSSFVWHRCLRHPRKSNKKLVPKIRWQQFLWETALGIDLKHEKKHGTWSQWRDMLQEVTSQHHSWEWLILKVMVTKITKIIILIVIFIIIFITLFNFTGFSWTQWRY